MKKMAALIVEECKEITDKIKKNSHVKENKTIALIKKIKDCKPFVASSILFVCVSVIVTAIMIYFCCNLKNNSVLPD